MNSEKFFSLKCYAVFEVFSIKTRRFPQGFFKSSKQTFVKHEIYVCFADNNLMPYCFLFPLQARKRKTDRDIHKLESELESLKSRVLKAAKDSGTGAGVRMETVLEVSWDWRKWTEC